MAGQGNNAAMIRVFPCVANSSCNYSSDTSPAAFSQIPRRASFRRLLFPRRLRLPIAPDDLQSRFYQHFWLGRDFDQHVFHHVADGLEIKSAFPRDYPVLACDDLFLCETDSEPINFHSGSGKRSPCPGVAGLSLLLALFTLRFFPPRAFLGYCVIREPRLVGDDRLDHFADVRAQ